jgi:outer membrane protein assembly factor BamB
MHAAANKIRFSVSLILTVFCSSVFSTRGVAGDWPQILGPNRNGVAVDEKPVNAWPAAGPKVNWSFLIGSGYAGPVVVGDRVIIFHRVGDVERVESIDVATGKSVWKTDYPATYSGGYNPDKGPRCVPLVSGDRIFVFGAGGNLHALKLADGKEIWSRDTGKDFPNPVSYFGSGSSPIVAGEKLLINVGGRNSGIVAFDLETGATAWTKTDERASYSSPTKTVIGGQEQVIFVTRMNTMAVNPQTGAELFRFQFGDRGLSVSAATPLVFDNHLFVSASYGVGGHLARLTKNSATKIWANDSSMSSQYTTCVHKDGFLYGTHGREDHSNGELRCIEAKTGKVKWTAPGFGVAHTILIGDHLLMLTNQGHLALVDASPARYKLLASAQLTPNFTRAMPAFAKGRLLFRDNANNGGTLKCLTLGTP